LDAIGAKRPAPSAFRFDWEQPRRPALPDHLDAIGLAHDPQSSAAEEHAALDVHVLPTSSMGCIRGCVEQSSFYGEVVLHEDALNMDQGALTAAEDDVL
jgi:hypothetical protein